MKNFKLKTTPAFTLLEMLLVIAIIAILAGIVIVAINPGRQLAQARNAQRASDLRAIHSAVNQYYIDNLQWPGDLETTTELTEICNTGTESEGHSIDCVTGGLIDLSSLVPTYLSAIPTDPQGSITSSIPFTKQVYAQSTGTGYKIAINPTSQTVMLTAPNSVEYNLTPVQLGTTVLVGGGAPTGCDVTSTGTFETTTDGNYTITKYTAGSGTFVVNSGTCDVEVLVVAGGGGGGRQHGGGGGGGGVISSGLNLAVGDYEISVGNGGAGSNSSYGRGANGQNSYFDNLISIGGGGGGSRYSANGAPGGSGGGAGYNGNPGSGTLEQGYNGGDDNTAGPYPAGGGGGASSIGSSGTIVAISGGNAGYAGDGGDGIQTDISGITTHYGGGGGGGIAGYYSAHESHPGLGGLGGGTDGTVNGSPNNALANTGGGGGGAGGSTTGGSWQAGNGGSGVVIVRYIAN